MLLGFLAFLVRWLFKRKAGAKKEQRDENTTGYKGVAWYLKFHLTYYSMEKYWNPVIRMYFLHCLSD